MTLEQNITALRKEKKLSQSELGKRADTSGDLIGRYEKDLLKRFQEVSTLPETAKKQIYMVMDALIRDFKTGQAYAAR